MKKKICRIMLIVILITTTIEQYNVAKGASAVTVAVGDEILQLLALLGIKAGGNKSSVFTTKQNSDGVYETTVNGIQVKVKQETQGNALLDPTLLSWVVNGALYYNQVKDSVPYIKSLLEQGKDTLLNLFEPSYKQIRAKQLKMLNDKYDKQLKSYDAFKHISTTIIDAMKNEYNVGYFVGTLQGLLNDKSYVPVIAVGASAYLKSSDSDITMPVNQLRLMANFRDTSAREMYIWDSVDSIWLNSNEWNTVNYKRHGYDYFSVKNDKYDLTVGTLADGFEYLYNKNMYLHKELADNHLLDISNYDTTKVVENSKVLQDTKAVRDNVKTKEPTALTKESAVTVGQITNRLEKENVTTLEELYEHVGALEKTRVNTHDWATNVLGEDTDVGEVAPVDGADDTTGSYAQQLDRILEKLGLLEGVLTGVTGLEKVLNGVLTQADLIQVWENERAKVEEKENTKEIAKEKTLIDNLDLNNFTVGEMIKTRFPFSIPFDLIDCVKIMVSQPKIPVMNLDFKYKSYGGSMKVDLTPWDPLAKMVRSLLVIMFIIGLVKMTRSLIKG